MSRTPGTVTGWGWHDLSRADTGTVAAISLGWQDLGLGPQRQRAQRAVVAECSLCADHVALEAWAPLQP